MTSLSFERGLLWAVRIGLFLALLTPLILFKSLFFPYITGKNFYFRILVECVFATWVVLATLVPQFRPRLGPILYAIGAFIGVLVVATIFGANPYHSFWSNYERMEGLVTHLHLLAFFLVLSSTLKTKKEWFYFANAIVGVGALVAMHGFLQSVHVFTVTGEGRPYATLGNTIYLGVYMIFNFFILGILLSSVRNANARIAYGMILALDVYVFWLAASRGAFIGLAAGIACIAVGMLFVAKKRSFRIASLSVLAVIILLALVIFFFPKSGFVQSNQLFRRFSAAISNGLTNDPRVLIWGIAWRGFLERPILGWGPENFIEAYSKYYNPALFGNEPWFDRAHNMLLEWLVASGLVGFLAYVAIFVMVGFVLWRLVKRKALEALPAFMVGGLFVAYVVQNVFVFDNIVTYLTIFSMLAFLHAMSSESPEVHHKSHKISPAVLLSATGSIVALLLVLYFVNIKPILASSQIITALQSISEKQSADKIISNFDGVFAYNTFGTSEARERLADSSTGIILNGSAKPTEDSFKLLGKGIEELEKELKRFPNSAKTSLFLGKAYAIQFYGSQNPETIKKAQAAYDRALEIAPTYVQIRIARAELYLVTRQADKAKHEADEAWKLTHRSANLMYDILSTYVLINDAADAKATFLQFVKENNFTYERNDFEGEKIAAVAQRSMQSEPHARLDFLQTVVGFVEKTPDIHVALAQTYAELGDKSKAASEARRAGELNPSIATEVEKFIQSLGAIK